MVSVRGTYNAKGRTAPAHYTWCCSYGWGAHAAHRRSIGPELTNHCCVVLVAIKITNRDVGCYQRYHRPLCWSLSEVTSQFCWRLSNLPTIVLVAVKVTNHFVGRYQSCQPLCWSLSKLPTTVLVAVKVSNQCVVGNQSYQSTCC